jgi:Domain of unknown function (DUF3127)
MSFEVTGKLVAKYDTVQRTETFRTREFVIEKNEEFNGRIISNYIKFQCVQERTTMPDRFNLGDEVKVSFNIKGTKWMKDGRENYITNLDAWRVEHIKLAQEVSQPSSASSASPTYNEDADDLPF